MSNTFLIGCKVEYWEDTNAKERYVNGSINIGDVAKAKAVIVSIEMSSNVPVFVLLKEDGDIFCRRYSAIRVIDKDVRKLFAKRKKIMEKISRADIMDLDE